MLEQKLGTKRAMTALVVLFNEGITDPGPDDLKVCLQELFGVAPGRALQYISGAQHSYFIDADCKVTSVGEEWLMTNRMVRS